MSEYNSNYEIAQAISERIGTAPIPFDSVYEICLAIYNELGGEPAQFDSVYEILLGILPLAEGGSSRLIDDDTISTEKTWSSSKISSELEQVDVDPITNINELPEASENKNKFYRLSSDDNVYVSELKSRTTITTNRLPDEQQIDKAYLYVEYGAIIFHYKGAWKILLTDGNEIDGYGWLSYTNDNAWYIHITNDNAENASLSTLTLFIRSKDAEGIDLVNHTVTYDDTITEYNWNTAVDVMNWDIVAVIPAIYNAPESAQISNAYVTDSGNVDTGIYNGTLVTFEDTQGSGEDVTGYKWTIEGSNESYIATSKPASEIYFYYDEDNDAYYTDATVWGVYYDIDSQKWKSEIAIIHSDNNSLYIPQLNAPDSEQVDKATITVEDLRKIDGVWQYCEDVFTYIGTLSAMDYDSAEVETYYAYKNEEINIIVGTEIAPSDMYNLNQFEGYVKSFYPIPNPDYNEDMWMPDYGPVTDFSTVKYQRTEVTEEWDWQPLTDNATNEDIDLMFANEIKLIRYQDAEQQAEGFVDMWVNTSGETMEYDGQTYYKWVSWGNDGSEGAEPAVENPDYIMLTNTLDISLPFNSESPEFEYTIIYDSEGDTWIDSNYFRGDYTQKDGSITYEE